MLRLWISTPKVSRKFANTWTLRQLANYTQYYWITSTLASRKLRATSILMVRLSIYLKLIFFIHIIGKCYFKRHNTRFYWLVFFIILVDKVKPKEVQLPFM